MPRKSIPDDVRASLVAPIERLARLDPWDAFHAGNNVNEVLLEAQSQVAEIRRSAIRRLRAGGYTLREIADEVGVAPARIHQMETGYDRREKAARRRKAERAERSKP